MLDRLRQIAIFAKTVDHGSFRGAAHELRLSPSVVSHHISQLEEHLGCALLYRSTRKLALTPEGERFLTSAHQMIEAAELGLQDLSNVSNQHLAPIAPKGDQLSKKKPAEWAVSSFNIYRIASNLKI